MKAINGNSRAINAPIVSTSGGVARKVFAGLYFQYRTNLASTLPPTLDSIRGSVGLLSRATTVRHFGHRNTRTRPQGVGRLHPSVSPATASTTGTPSSGGFRATSQPRSRSRRNIQRLHEHSSLLLVRRPLPGLGCRPFPPLLRPDPLVLNPLLDHVKRDNAISREHHAVPEDVHELPDVPPPIMVSQPVHRVFSKLKPDTGLSVLLTEEALDDPLDLPPPFPERRHVVARRQPANQILSEDPLCDRRTQIPVRRGDHTDVRLENRG